MTPLVIGNRVKALLVMHNIKRSYLAKELGVSYNTLTKKLNGQREFGIKEIIKMKEIFNLDLDLFANIFFDPSFLVSQANRKVKN